ncbi:hypothetical protein PR202_ga19882 [Eleusine coracana subsp. coracana]|uniref:Uncharacterized protein n=1 Tax=Eleusine coracana subsp. coracana TaxID=191504 RepID=A0AAV5CWL8_ELECO|nr:hypothetical protein PR202_ga19882 [Eleusine coracana subsp. coracana]
MALNCSSRSLLLSDDCAGKMLGCGCWSEEASPLSSCGFNSLWWDELELELEEGVEESDPVARLPSDPFEMNLEATSATITAAIANCIEDFTARSCCQPFGSGGNDDFIVDLLNYTFIFAPNPCVDGYMGVFEGSFWSGGPSGFLDASQPSWLPPDAPCSQPSRFAESPFRSQDAALACCDVVGAGPSGFAESPSSSQHAVLACCDAVGAAPCGFAENPSRSYDATLVCCDAVGSAPGQEGNDAHPGIFVALGYLGLRDILSIEMVCKSLCSAVRSEFCSWKCIHIDSQLGEKISDADLLRLTHKSPGVLQCLSLVRCKNVTDQGLKAVLQSNPQLTKLGIFGNVRITHQGLLDNLRSFNVEANLHDEYALDIERCPLCDKYKHVYDCPGRGLQEQQNWNLQSGSVEVQCED